MIGVGALGRLLFGRRRQPTPGTVQIVSVREAPARRPPAFYEGQIVLLQPRASEQPHAGPTPVRVLKFTRDRLVCAWLADDEFQQIARAEAGVLKGRRDRRWRDRP